MLFFCIFKYLTILSLIFVIFWKYTKRYIDLPVLALCVAFIAFPIFYLSPNQIDLSCFGITSENKPNFLHIIFFDMLYHWLPLVYVLINRGIDKRPYDYVKIITTLLMVLVYIYWFDAFKLYNFQSAELGMVFFALAAIVRFII